MSDDAQPVNGAACAAGQAGHTHGLKTVTLQPTPPPADYREAMQLADDQARQLLGDAMLLSWYDRDRDFESPQHASECHLDSAVPGYVDYALSHGATLKVEIGQGRFVFFYLPLPASEMD